MRIFPWSNVYLMRAAVSVRLATVIMTGGVGAPLAVPLLRSFEPVLAQEVIALLHQIWQRLMLLGPAIDVVLHFGIGVDVIEARFVIGGESAVVTDDHAWCFTRPDSMASFRPKSLTIHPKSVSSVLRLPVGANGVAERSWHARMPRVLWMRSRPPIHCVASSSSSFENPWRRLRRHAPSVVRFVVDDEPVLVVGVLVQHPPRESLVALWALFHHLGAGVRVQRHERMPIPHERRGPGAISRGGRAE